MLKEYKKSVIKVHIENIIYQSFKIAYLYKKKIKYNNFLNSLCNNFNNNNNYEF